MDLGVRLLDLVVEYEKAKKAEEWAITAGRPADRDPSVIAAEYVDVLRQAVNLDASRPSDAGVSASV